MLKGLFLAVLAIWNLPAHSAEYVPPTKDEWRCMQRVVDRFVEEHPEIYFIVDGCCGRAWKLHDEIVKECGEQMRNKVQQVWLKGHLCPGGPIIWGHHTTLCCFDSKMSCWVYDPAMESGPIELEVWKERCRNTNPGSEKCEITFVKKIASFCPAPPKSKPEIEAGRIKAKANNCYYKCWGELIKDLQLAAKNQPGRDAAMKECQSCADKCKADGHVAPPRFYQNKHLQQDCAWAATFENTARACPKPGTTTPINPGGTSTNTTSFSFPSGGAHFIVHENDDTAPESTSIEDDTAPPEFIVPVAYVNPETDPLPDPTVLTAAPESSCLVDYQHPIDSIPVDYGIPPIEPVESPTTSPTVTEVPVRSPSSTEWTWSWWSSAPTEPVESPVTSPTEPVESPVTSPTEPVESPTPTPVPSTSWTDWFWSWWYGTPTEPVENKTPTPEPEPSPTTEEPSPTTEPSPTPSQTSADAF